MSKRISPWGLVAEFPSSAALLRAIERSRAEGYEVMDAFSPYPIEEISEALGQLLGELPYALWHAITRLWHAIAGLWHAIAWLWHAISRNGLKTYGFVRGIPKKVKKNIERERTQVPQ